MLWRVPVGDFSTVYNENPQPPWSLFLFSTASGDWSSLPRFYNLNPTYQLRFVIAATHTISEPSIGLMFKALFYQIYKSPQPKGQRIKSTKAVCVVREKPAIFFLEWPHPSGSCWMKMGGSQWRNCESNTVQDLGLVPGKGKVSPSLGFEFPPLHQSDEIWVWSWKQAAGKA